MKCEHENCKNTASRQFDYCPSSKGDNEDCLIRKCGRHIWHQHYVCDNCCEHLKKKCHSKILFKKKRIVKT